MSGTAAAKLFNIVVSSFISRKKVDGTIALSPLLKYNVTLPISIANYNVLENVSGHCNSRRNTR